MPLLANITNRPQYASTQLGSSLNTDRAWLSGVIAEETYVVMNRQIIRQLNDPLFEVVLSSVHDLSWSQWRIMFKT